MLKERNSSFQECEKKQHESRSTRTDEKLGRLWPLYQWSEFRKRGSVVDISYVIFSLQIMTQYGAPVPESLKRVQGGHKNLCSVMEYPDYVSFRRAIKISVPYFQNAR